MVPYRFGSIDPVTHIIPKFTGITKIFPFCFLVDSDMPSSHHIPVHEISRDFKRPLISSRVFSFTQIPVSCREWLTVS